MPLTSGIHINNEASWKPFMVVFAPIDKKEDRRSFEEYICEAYSRGYEIIGKIDYITDKTEEEIWAITCVQLKHEKSSTRPVRKQRRVVDIQPPCENQEGSVDVGND